MKLGFIGLGIMGTPMAINLARAGHQLHVTTIGPVADELLSLGAVSVETARQVTEASDIIFIMVPDTPQVEEVLFGENGCTKASLGNDSNLLIVFYVQIMPDDFVMQLHRF